MLKFKWLKILAWLAFKNYKHLHQYLISYLTNKSRVVIVRNKILKIQIKKTAPGVFEKLS